MSRMLITALAAIAALAVAAPASAKETTTHHVAYTQNSVTIDASAYDLDTTRGAERFAGVLSRTARRVCDTGDRSLTSRRLERACVAETMRNTVAQIDKPYLTAALGQQSPGRIVVASR
jgi:UrcA family protein